MWGHSRTHRRLLVRNTQSNSTELKTLRLPRQNRVGTAPRCRLEGTNSLTNQSTQQRARPRATAQPGNFWPLAFTEVWERFSYYGLSGVLTFYLLYSLADGGLELSPVEAVSIVGAYGGAIYLSSVLGAWVADRVISPRNAILVGGIVIMSGHVSLALVPGMSGLGLGLGLIAIGTGLLKTSISAIVGILYDGRPREHRDAGFSYFYMAINIGAIFGPLLTGLTQSIWGFHVAFGLAAVGMLFSILQYVSRIRSLPSESKVVKNPISRTGIGRAAAVLVTALFLVFLLFNGGIINNDNLNYVVGLMILGVVISYFWIMLRTDKTTIQDKRRIRGYIPLWVAETIYYGLLLQIFTTIPLFVTDRVNLEVGGWKIPEAWFSFIGTVALVLAIPLVATLWKDHAIGRLRATPKFGIGLVTVGVAYLLMLFAELTPGRTVSPFLIAFCLIIAGISELFVGPIGMSLVTRMAPEPFKSQMIAVKILTLGAGSTISGLLGTLYTQIPTAPFLAIVGSIGILSAVILAASSPLIESLLGEEPHLRREL